MAAAGAGAGASAKRLKRDDTSGLALHQLIGDVVQRFVGPKAPLSSISICAAHHWTIGQQAVGKWRASIRSCAGMSLDEETTSGGGFMIEAFAEKDNDMSSVILVASEFHSRRVIIELTRQAAQAARIAHATAAEFAEARRLARAQLDAWQDFPASSGQWTRERKSKAPMMTDIELEGGPLMALGLRLPPLVGAVGAPIPHLPSSYCLPGAEMTELRKKCICVVPATQANKDMLKRIFERQMNFGDDMDISEDGPVRVWGFEEMDIAAWFRYWPTTPAAAGLAAPAALVAPVAPVL